MKLEVATRDEMISRLLEKIDELGSQKAFAEYAGVKEPYLSLALHSHKPLGDKLARAVGYRREVVYVRGGRA